MTEKTTVRKCRKTSAAASARNRRKISAAGIRQKQTENDCGRFDGSLTDHRGMTFSGISQDFRKMRMSLNSPL